MDIDSRINWMPGMELTAQTFLELDRNLDYRQQVAVRAALGAQRLGLLPDAEFSCQGVFVKNAYEIERFRCLAILPSGRILSADEPVSLTIPMLFGSEYYLTVTYGGDEHTFEREGVPCVRMQKEFAIHSLDELSREDLLPVARFRVSDGVFSVDSDYIPPCLLMTADERFAGFGATYTAKLQELAGHANLEDGDGKRTLLRYLFLLKGYDWSGSVRDFISLTQEIAQAVDYFIITPHAEKPVEIPVPSQYDVQKWLSWLSEYLSGASGVLDTVVLEDDSIDFEALLAQAKAELYERLNPELHEKLLQQVKEELHDELRTQLSDSLTAYIDGKLRPELHNMLSSELDPSLHDKLYPELYDALYDALFVPTEEEKEFIPLM